MSGVRVATIQCDELIPMMCIWARAELFENTVHMCMYICIAGSLVGGGGGGEWERCM